VLAVTAGIALAVLTRGERPVAVASDTIEPRVIELPSEPRQDPVREAPPDKPNPEPPQEAPREPPRESSPEPPPEPSPEPPRGSSPEEPAAEELPVVDRVWQRPTQEEAAIAEQPRHYPAERRASLTLTIEALGLHRVPVINSDSPGALSRGVIHEPETPMPWKRDHQKNVYLAGHRLGYPGSGSRLVFYNLDELSAGDSVTLEDRDGATYEYRVTETFKVSPRDEWVMDPVRDRDIVTLQTCTGPGYSQRLIVRADRVLSAAVS
jgi:sortase A